MKLDNSIEQFLVNAYRQYHYISKTTPVSIKNNNLQIDGFQDLLEDQINALTYLEKEGYIKDLIFSLDSTSYSITQKGLEYFDPPAPVPQIHINQGDYGNVITGNNNQLNINITGDTILEINNAAIDEEHKKFLTELFLELSKSPNKPTIKDTVKNFVNNILTGVVTDSAKSSLIFAIEKLAGI